MNKTSIYKIEVSNNAKTVLYFIANSKLDTILKYNKYIKELNYPSYINDKTNFNVEFVNYAYE